MQNEDKIILELTRREIYDLMLACTAISASTDARKWGILHDKLCISAKDRENRKEKQNNNLR